MENVNLSYASLLGAMKNSLKNKKSLERDLKEMNKNLLEQQTLFVQMLNAQKVLSTLAEENTNQVLDFITSMVNKVLAEIFTNDPCSITMKRKLFAGSKPHVVIELIDSEGNVLDSSVQAGTGLSQIISFMYVVCLVEIRKGRRFLILDERLSGLHKEAKRFISHIIEIFVQGGFQFIFVEYSLNDIGKIYNVEKRGNKSVLVPVEGEYDDTLIFTSEVDLSILDKDYKDDEDDGEELTL